MRKNPQTLSKTKIDWATHVWNPITGCKNNHAFCYAEKLYNTRRTNWYGEGAKRAPFQYIWEHPERYQMRTPKNAFVFINSMGEPFFWDEAQLIRVFNYVRANKQATFLLLTHNLLFIHDHLLDVCNHIPTNLKLGLSVTDDETLLHLCKKGGIIDFISIEPFQLCEGPGMQELRYIDRNDFEIPFVQAIIGGQTPANRAYFQKWGRDFGKVYEFLNTLEDKGDVKVLVKDNAVGFSIEPTVNATNKNQVLGGFWN